MVWFHMRIYFPSTIIRLILGRHCNGFHNLIKLYILYKIMARNTNFLVSYRFINV